MPAKQQSPVFSGLPVRHPWRRYAARMIDSGLYALLLLAIVSATPLRAWRSSLPLQLASGPTAMLLALIFEPLLLSSWGSTPGKWLLGLRLRDRDGGRLTYHAALRRTGQVILRGCGCGVVLIDLICMLLCSRRCLDGPMPWDSRDEHRYTLTDTALWRMPAAVLVLGIVIVCTAQLMRT